MMPMGDLRAHYLMTGATWTLGGAPPGPVDPGGPPANIDWPLGNAIGASQLANSVLETYFQGDPHYRTGLNCFDCHSNGQSLNPADANGLSHIFSVLEALP
jgi:hypothetical protein